MKRNSKLFSLRQAPLWLPLSLVLSGCGADSENDIPLVDLKVIPPSEICEFGGSAVRTGIDANENGLLEDSEVISTTNNCNEEVFESLVSLQSIEPSEQCEFGGSEVSTGFDNNKNGELDEDEVQSSSFTCNAEEEPEILATSMNLAVMEDEATAGQLLAAAELDNLSYHLSLFPFKGTLALNEDGSFVYTPNANATGSDVFTYYISNDGVQSNTGVVEINIAGINDAPVAQTSSLYAYNTSTAQSQLAATDVDGQALTYSLLDNPVSGSATISESGLLSYTANEGYLGSDQITFSVSDGELTASAEVSITVIDTVLQITSESPAQYSVEQGVKEQQRTTLTNLGDDSVLVWTTGNPAWYSRVSDVIVIPGNSQVEVAFDIDARTLAEGDYQGNVTYTSAEPGMPTLTQSLSLAVTADVSPPAMVSDLAISGIAEYDRVNLNWTAVADSGRRGLAVSSYEVRYASTTITEENWDAAIVVDLSQEPSEPQTTETVLVTNLNSEVTYYFAIKSTDRFDRVSELSNVLSFTTPTPAVPEMSDVTVSVREAEQITVDIEVTNSGQSPLRYFAELTVNGLTPEPAMQANSHSAKLTSTKIKTLNVASVANNSGDIIIKLNGSQPSARSFTDVLSQYNLQETKSIDALGIKVVRPASNDPADMVQIINDLNSLTDVAYAEPDYNVQALYLPNDALFVEQWALNNEGQSGGAADADIDATETWDRFKNGANVLMAVIDTGVKYDHEDLVGNIWSNPNEIAGNGLDDDNNGYIDDVHGYDFVNSDGDPMDDNDHGTHVSGILGARGDNNVGIVGAAHTAQIMGVKFLSASGSGTTSGAIDSVMYAVDNGAKVLNNSWGGGAFSQALFDAISYANDHDVLFIAAAGNNGSNNDTGAHYPSNYDLPNVISVASSDHNDSRSSFSNYGQSVDLAAPGSDILSSVKSGGYDSFSGTSMATPYVAGAAILIRSNFPELSALETKEILLSSVDVLDNWNGVVATGGRLNIDSALALAAETGYMTISEGREGEVAPGESVTLQVSIDATAKLAGLYEHEITLTTNAPGFETVTASLDVTVEFDLVAPATIDSLMLFDMSANSATLQWLNSGDDGTLGQASKITLAYSTTEITAENWSDATLVGGPTPTESGTGQSFTVGNLSPETLYYFAMKVMDNSGQYSELSNIASATTPLGAVIAITPESIADVSLTEGDSTSTLSLAIANNGDEVLEYSFELIDQIDDSTPTQQLESVAHEKGEEDTRIGSVSPQGSGGPDNYGYQWRDSDEGGVSYDWTDISGTGTSLTFGDDTVSSPVNLGFNFNFYGVDYSQVYVSSNGFLSFSSTGNGCCSGQPLPSVDGYQNLIAWAWTDLIPRTGSSVNYVNDGENFILQFSDYGEYGRSGFVTAQIILSSNGKVKIQYHSFTNGFDTSRVSVGIENSDSTDGLQVVFNAAYLKDELAIEFSTALPWISLSQSSGSVEVGADADYVDLILDATDIAPGIYEGFVVIESNDATQGEISLPVRLEVTAAAPI